MTRLAQLQAAFIDQLLAEDAPLPEGWTGRHAAGLQIYRQGYRARLVEALGETFERVRRYLGSSAFRQAAVNHLIEFPPSGWSLDAIGEGFDGTCARLFPERPEVTDLARLEWAMHGAAKVMPFQPIDRADFLAATAAFDEADWLGLQLAFAPGAELVASDYDLARLWTSLGSHDPSPECTRLGAEAGALVYREGETPVFLSLDGEAAKACTLLLGGASYGEACRALASEQGEAGGLAKVGDTLALLLDEGVIVGVGRSHTGRNAETRIPSETIE